MLFPGPLLEARFVRRDNRFRATVLLDGCEVTAHVANSGRLAELCVAGHPCFISPATAPTRKTRFDLRLIAYADTLVSLDTQLPNALCAEALAAGRIVVPGYPAGSLGWRREAWLGHSRIDFLLTAPAASPCWLETKSVSLVRDGVALFPDAVTARGRRHLAELLAAVQAGDRAALVFVVQRGDAAAVAPHRDADPAFAAALASARAGGVHVLAYTCAVTLQGVEILAEIPVLA